ncbi:xanthine dehydrogenase family Fe-S subunit [Pacificispira sp.]|jgi:carbon-monoxide dehydrogenase small subunit|uniref:xanthine dehydrogenase family Fe-S subunit n=1 Tax=Pacificispira sp. TaxID=2888761 RepID=UPI003B527DAC
MKSITLTVNGQPVSGSVEPRTHLADFLRGQMGLTGTHLGCEQGVCGACTILIDGQPGRSCIALAAACDGADIRTVEGFDDDPTMARLRKAFSERHGLQCGFCTPGMLVTARDIVNRLDTPDEARIRHALSGNICRCTGYQGIVEAISDVVAETAAEKAPCGAPIAPLGRAAPDAPPPSFEIAERRDASSGSGAASATISKPVMRVDDDGWTVLTLVMKAEQPRTKLWEVMTDIPTVARCMPGAEVTAVEGDRIQGRLTIRFGPISAGFNGTLDQQVDASARRVVLSGEGADAKSGTNVQGQLTYALRTEAEERTAVDIEVRFKLTGPLAQFGRSGLVRDFTSRLSSDFAGNLGRLLAGEDIGEAQQRQLSVLALLWGVLRDRLFRR